MPLFTPDSIFLASANSVHALYGVPGTDLMPTRSQGRLLNRHGLYVGAPIEIGLADEAIP